MTMITDEHVQDVNSRNMAIQNTTKAVHNETVRIVDAQLGEMAVQMAALDEFVTRAREQNGRHHDSHCESLKDLSTNLRQTFGNMDDKLQATSARMQNHSAVWRGDIGSLDESLLPFSRSIQDPLAGLMANFSSNPLIEYVATGQTPQKKDWTYPTDLPRTASQESLLARLRGLPDSTPTASRSPRKIASPRKTVSPRKGFSSPSKLPSPTKTRVFHDDVATGGQIVLPTQRLNEPADESKGGLREMDMNVLARPSSADDAHGHPQTTFSKSTSNTQQPPLKRHATAESKLPRKGRENTVLSQSMGPGYGIGRRLRSSPQQ
jgi:kinesin family member 11